MGAIPRFAAIVAETGSIILPFSGYIRVFILSDRRIIAAVAPKES